ncbi:MAG: immunoglobulin domain-containing protein [Verrucomicrobiota bacterium]
MKRLTRTLPLLLAAALQLLPLLRNIVTSPAAGSSFAIILRWGIGSAAALGAVDAVSGATSSFTTTNAFYTGTGLNFTNNVIVNITGGNNAAASDYFYISSGSVLSANLANGQSTTNGLPKGLTFLARWTNGVSSIGGIIFGTPAVVGTNPATITVVSPGNAILSQNVTFYITNAVVASAPIITNQPVSLTNNVGTAASFSVTNGGTSPFKYQWYFNTNTALLNQTNSALAFTSVQLTNAGNYSVVITNSAGSVTSSYALLTVWQPPVITNQPTSITSVAGGNGTFNILAGGVPTLAYQWKFNTNTALLNATNISLSLTNLRASQAGVYTVVITNSAGSVTSSIANLVITNPNPPTMSAPVKNGSLFQFTFVPVVGLTNSVLTNSVITGGSWGVLTNVPPPSTASPITVTDPFSSTNRFYRVQIVP